MGCISFRKLNIIALVALTSVLVGCGDTDSPTNSSDGSSSHHSHGSPHSHHPQGSPGSTYRRVDRTDSQNPCIAKAPIGRIHFDCTISNGLYEKIREDLYFLQRQAFFGASADELGDVLHLPEISGAGLFNWLEERVQFVLDSTFRANAPTNIAGQNISNSFIKVYRNPFASVDVPGFGPVEVSSQRVGVILLGQMYDFQPAGISGRADRLATLLHEARHNDGRHGHNGFPHSPCPNGHQEGDGSFACDRCNNGPHRIQKLFYRTILDHCDSTLSCSEQDRLNLQARWNWSDSNILLGATECDDTPEFL